MKAKIHINDVADGDYVEVYKNGCHVSEGTIAEHTPETELSWGTIRVERYGGGVEWFIILRNYTLYLVTDDPAELMERTYKEN